MRNHSNENEFRLQVHCHAKQTHFHLNGYVLRLVLKQRHKGTQKWPIDSLFATFTAVGDSKRIQLENMLGVYLVLAAGGFFSVILVLIEMWWRKHGSNVMAALRTRYSFMR